MQVQYLEIVSDDVDSACGAWEATVDARFSEPVAELGNARTAATQSGGLIGVRAPMHDAETPVIRPYWLVDDIESAVAKVADTGAEILHPPLEIPGRGTFAMFVAGGVQQGFWQN